MRYDSYRMPDGRTTVRPTRNGSSTTAQMLEVMERTCSLTASDAKGFLAFLSSYLADELSHGRCVTLDEIGTFGVSLRTAADDESRLTGRDVEYKRVTFRAAPVLGHRIAERLQTERVARDARNSSTPRYTIDQRRALLSEVLARHPRFTATHYRAATHTSKATASRDLRQFVTEGLIVPTHIGSAIIYTAP